MTDYILHMSKKFLAQGFSQYRHLPRRSSFALSRRLNLRPRLFPSSSYLSAFMVVAAHPLAARPATTRSPGGTGSTGRLQTELVLGLVEPQPRACGGILLHTPALREARTYDGRRPRRGREARPLLGADGRPSTGRRGDQRQIRRPSGLCAYSSSAPHTQLPGRNSSTWRSASPEGFPSRRV